MKLSDAVEDTAAVFRLTRLLTQDALTDGLRARIAEQGRQRMLSTGDELVTARRYGQDIVDEGGPLAYLVQCPWCASIWIGAGVAVARRVAPLPWALAARVLTMSAVTGWLAERS